MIISQLACRKSSRKYVNLWLWYHCDTLTCWYQYHGVDISSNFTHIMIKTMRTRWSDLELIKTPITRPQGRAMVRLLLNLTPKITARYVYGDFTLLVFIPDMVVVCHKATWWHSYTFMDQWLHCQSLDSWPSYQNSMAYIISVKFYLCVYTCISMISPGESKATLSIKAIYNFGTKTELRHGLKAFNLIHHASSPF